MPVRGGDESIKAFASYNPEAGERTVLLYVPPGHNSQQVNVDFPLGPEAQLLTISTVDGLRSGITGVYLLEPGAGTTTVTVTVPTRGGVALTTGPLAPQPAVKIDVRWQKRTGRVGDETTAIVSVWNVSAEPLTGRLRLRGFPGEILSDVNLDLPTLEPGERCLETVELLLTKVTDAEGDAVVRGASSRPVWRGGAFTAAESHCLPVRTHWAKGGCGSKTSAADDLGK